MSYEPKIQIARLFQKKAASGRVYFTGRMGNARLLLFRNERSESSDPEWSLFVQAIPDDGDSTNPQAGNRSQRPPQAQQQAAAPSRQDGVRMTKSGITRPAKRSKSAPMHDKPFDDAIPF